MQLTREEINRFQDTILSWYHLNKRSLPWRDIPFDTTLRQRDPYKILISEIMSQQTQLLRVIPKYEAWMKRFPTVGDLAKAPTREVLLYWSGLGYNRRALNLQKAARILVEEYKGEFPRGYEDLVRLPGIGKYTVNALRCFAFNEQVAVVDTNVRKVILLEVLKAESSEQGSVSEKEIEGIAQQLLPMGKAYEWNQALMDYASAMLKNKKIIVPKQAPFRSSNRYYRGHIMKILVRQQTVTISDLMQYFTKHNPISNDRLEKILLQMEKEGLLKVTGKTVQIV